MRYLRCAVYNKFHLWSVRVLQVVVQAIWCNGTHPVDSDLTYVDVLFLDQFTISNRLARAAATSGEDQTQRFSETYVEKVIQARFCATTITIIAMCDSPTPVQSLIRFAHWNHAHSTHGAAHPLNTKNC